jgi:hypothetical protein
VQIAIIPHHFRTNCDEIGVYARDLIEPRANIDEYREIPHRFRPLGIQFAHCARDSFGGACAFKPAVAGGCSDLVGWNAASYGFRAPRPRPVDGTPDRLPRAKYDVATTTPFV